MRTVQVLELIDFICTHGSQVCPSRSSDSLCTCSLPIYRQWSLKDSLRILALLQYVHDTELSVSHRAIVLWWWAGTSTAALATLR